MLILQKVFFYCLLKNTKCMDNRELIAKLSRSTKATQEKTKEFLDAFVEEITDKLGAGNHIEFLDFGVLQTVVREQKIITNPKTQKRTLYPPKNVVELKVTKSVKEHIKNIQK